MKRNLEKGTMFELNCKPLMHGILFCLIVVIMTGCGSSAEFTPKFKTVSVSLAWDAPTTYIDGTQLSQSDIREYRIYYTTEPGLYSADRYCPVSAPTTSATVTLPLTAKTVYLVVTTIDQSGVESDISNELRKNIY